MAGNWIVKNMQELQRVMTVEEKQNDILIKISTELSNQEIIQFLDLYIEELVAEELGIYENNTLVILKKDIERIDEDFLTLLKISNLKEKNIIQKKGQKMIAVTEDGKKIILNTDGTWEEYKEVVSSNKVYDVRKVNWGMSRSTVENIETAARLKDVDVLAYNVKLAGLDTLLVYDFFQDELSSVRYVFVNQHTDNGDFINDFDKLKDNLSKKYGKSLDDKRYFSDDLYDDTPAEWASALERGKLSFFTNWDNANTKVLLALFGDNYEVRFSLEYRGKDYIDLVNQDDEQQLLDDL